MTRNKPARTSRRTVLRATAGAAAALTGVAGATPGRRPGPKETEVLAGVAADAPLAATVRAHLPAGGAVVHRNGTLRYVAVDLSGVDETGRERFVDALRNDDGVRYVEPNRTYAAARQPNDPHWEDQHAPQQVNADDAWDIQFETAGVLAAVVDTGVDYTHSDLNDNFRSDPGRDFVDGDGDPAPDDPGQEYHGTYVTGLVGAETDNRECVAGISETTLVAGRALDEDGAGSASDIADAVQWAADQGAAVVNLSLGGGGFSQTMKDAVSYAYDGKGAFLVGAAGNSGADQVTYPAAYEEVVAVTALTSDGDLATFSNTGSAVELAAPGTNVLSTTTRTRECAERQSGTSASAAIASGVAALALAEWDLTNDELRRHLKATAVDVGLASDEQGCGRVDAYRAVARDPADTGTCESDCGARSTSETISDSLNGSGDADCWTWAWEFDSTCEVELSLTASSGLLEPEPDFDLYVNDGRAECPTTGDFDYASTDDGGERLVVTNPDTSTELYLLVDSASGSGSYDLTVTERST